MGILAPIIGAVVGSIASSALAPKSASVSAVAAPVAPAVPVMPTPDSTAVQQAQQLSISQQLQTQGRASTVLTQQNPTSSTGKLGA